jgi:hypothetical protein
LCVALQYLMHHHKLQVASSDAAAHASLRRTSGPLTNGWVRLTGLCVSSPQRPRSRWHLQHRVAHRAQVPTFEVWFACSSNPHSIQANSCQFHRHWIGPVRLADSTGWHVPAPLLSGANNTSHSLCAHRSACRNDPRSSTAAHSRTFC